MDDNSGKRRGEHQADGRAGREKKRAIEVVQLDGGVTAGAEEREEQAGQSRPTGEEADLRERVEKLERDFQRACRAAREAELRAEHAEQMLYSKIDIIKRARARATTHASQQSETREDNETDARSDVATVGEEEEDETMPVLRPAAASVDVVAAAAELCPVVVAHKRGKKSGKAAPPTLSFNTIPIPDETKPLDKVLQAANNLAILGPRVVARTREFGQSFDLEDDRLRDARFLAALMMEVKAESHVPDKATSSISAAYQAALLPPAYYDLFIAVLKRHRSFNIKKRFLFTRLYKAIAAGAGYEVKEALVAAAAPGKNAADLYEAISRILKAGRSENEQSAAATRAAARASDPAHHTHYFGQADSTCLQRRFVTLECMGKLLETHSAKLRPANIHALSEAMAELSAHIYARPKIRLHFSSGATLVVALFRELYPLAVDAFVDDLRQPGGRFSISSRLTMLPNLALLSLPSFALPFTPITNLSLLSSPLLITHRRVGACHCLRIHKGNSPTHTPIGVVIECAPELIAPQDPRSPAIQLKSITVL